ncbi:MAG: hypothetical protein LBP33_07605 [Candidatus Adiutrix sp.]|jgi:hypothetical protein|nr:hypothetical protein [Candidatus Adiutrix sp.]
MSQYAYLYIEVGGIQSFIFSTGKLREMIGASQAVVDLTEVLYDGVVQELGLTPVPEPRPGGGWLVEILKNAGRLRLVMAETGARRFLSAYSREALTRCPGLPLYGALTACDWDNESLKKAGDESSRLLSRQRYSRPAPAGLGLIPFVESAPRDGLAAAGRGLDNGWLSWPSLAREDRELITAADRRLKDQYNPAVREKLDAVGLPPNTAIRWCDDFSELLDGQEKGRLGLVHIDGNDLGRRFKEYADNIRTENPADRHKEMAKLSRSIDQANKAGLKAALARVAAQDGFGHQRTRRKAGDAVYHVPARPLVMGGDDLTAFVRADLAFDFVRAFVEAFEEASRAEGKQALTVGVGLLLMPPGYPFAKAYHLVEDLLGSAKKATLKAELPRSSSLDWLVLTSDVESDLDALRQRIYSAPNGLCLTAKPLAPKDGQSFAEAVDDFLARARTVLEQLPRAQVRAAAEKCRESEEAAGEAFRKLKENIERELGGRKGEGLIDQAGFEEIFPGGSFFKEEPKGKKFTALLDYLELAGLFKHGGEDVHAL